MLCREIRIRVFLWEIKWQLSCDCLQPEILYVSVRSQKATLLSLKILQLFTICLESVAGMSRLQWLSRRHQVRNRCLIFHWERKFWKGQRYFESAVAISSQGDTRWAKFLDPFRWYKVRYIKKRCNTWALRDNAGFLRKSEIVESNINRFFSYAVFSDGHA